MDLRERTAHPPSAHRHPWEQVRADIFARLVGALAAGGDPAVRLLDVGAGDDWLARRFLDALRRGPAPAATVTCWDVHYADDDLVAPAPDGLTRTATAPAGGFDLVTALDVLEHVEDEDAFLHDQVVAQLAPGGRVVLSVPAYQSLYGDHDRMLGHHRRYRPAALRAVVERHLDVVEQGSLFASLLVPRAVQIGLERLGRHVDERGVGGWTGGPLVTRLVTAALTADVTATGRLAGLGVHVPGLSAWVVARRRS